MFLRYVKQFNLLFISTIHKNSYTITADCETKKDTVFY